MTTDESTYRATVNDLVSNFRDALLALTPIADRAMLNYRDLNPHDDWEALAERVFDTFVRQPIEADRLSQPGDLPVGRYDFDLSDYSRLSWLTTAPDAPYESAFIRLLAGDGSFDTVQIVDIDPASHQAGEWRSVPVTEVTFALYRRDREGTGTVVYRVEALD